MSESTGRDEHTQAGGGGIAAITLFVEDLATAKRFYSDVFRLPVFFEDDNSTVFKFGDTLVQPAGGKQAPALVAPTTVLQLPTRVSGSNSRSV